MYLVLLTIQKPKEIQVPIVNDEGKTAHSHIFGIFALKYP